MFEEFKNRKIKTVKELIEKLKQLPEDTVVSCEGADIGGYDSIKKNYVDIRYNGATVHISHMEKELFNAYEDDLITSKQFKELNEEKD